MSNVPTITPEVVEQEAHAFLQKVVADTGVQQIVLGLSGGIDSAVVAALIVGALGPHALHCFWLPYSTSGAEHFADAIELAKQLGVSLTTIPISPVVDPYFSSQSISDPLRRGNMMARTRMMVLFDQAKALQALVAGTSNKTETLLGYGTLFGDTAWSCNPIGQLYKTQVRSLATYLHIPESIRTKAPTADLWAGQTDEEELGASYALMDEFLFLRYDRNIAFDIVVEQLAITPSLAKTLEDRVARNAFKSLPAPVALFSTACFH